MQIFNDTKTKFDDLKAHTLSQDQYSDKIQAIATSCRNRKGKCSH